MGSALDMWSIEVGKRRSWGDRCQLCQVVVSDETEMLNHQCVSDSENQRRSVKRRRRAEGQGQSPREVGWEGVRRRVLRREDEEELPEEGGQSV